MKTILLSLLLFAGICLFWQCKHTKYTANNLPAKQIRWGSGGGFTGKVTTFSLLENGQIFNADGLGTPWVELAKTKGRKAKSLYETISTLGLAKLDFNHPGNMYNFIEVADSNGAHKITWGDPTLPLPAAVNDFFTQLNGLLPDKK